MNRPSRRSWNARRVSGLGLGLGLMLANGASSKAATLALDSAVATRPNAAAAVCLELVLDGDEEVAGTENLLTWEGECMSLLTSSCAADPAHGKGLFGTLQGGPGFVYKALVVSLSDTAPMPAGVLYCCDFLPHTDPGSCCSISATAPGASDSDGNAIPISVGPPGQVCVESSGGPGAPTPTVTPVVATEVPSAATATAGSGFNTRTPLDPNDRTRKPTSTGNAAYGDGDDGCVINSPSTDASWSTSLAQLLLFPILLVARRRRMS